jgi:hypothetical protein
MQGVPVLSESLPRASSGPFRVERDMFESVSALLPLRLARVPDRWVELREPAVGSVIPDLLIGEWLDDLRPLRRNFTVVEARVLALLEERDELFEADICQALLLSEPAAARAFSRIESSGLVIRTKGGRMALDSGGFTRGMVVTAVELKLRRWREALEQAISYLKFADRAYVVLDADRARCSSGMAQAFRGTDVGLFMLSAGGLTEVVSAREKRCVSVQRVQAVQKICISLTASGRLQPRVGTPVIEGA